MSIAILRMTMANPPVVKSIRFGRSQHRSLARDNKRRRPSCPDQGIRSRANRREDIIAASTPDKFYKRSQEKNTSPVAGFFLGFQPTPFEQDCSGVPFRISGRWFIQPALLVFSASGFHRFCASKPVRSETHKQQRLSGANHGSIGDSWPTAFSGCPRGTRVAGETERARGTPSLTNHL